MARQSLFASYEAEFQDLTLSIIPKLESSFLGHSGEQKRVDIKSTQIEIEEAEELVGQMELEIMNLVGSEKAQAMPRLKRYRTQLGSLKKDLKIAIGKVEMENNRLELLNSRNDTNIIGASNNSIDYDQRSRLLDGNSRLDQSEAIGANILNDLRLQREQIINTRESLMQADTHLDSSQRTLKAMARRLAANKLISYAAIIVVISFVILFLYIKLAPSGSGK
ncbi:hypothetical protein BB561_002057 [Smittium simulii]|uniref:Vesicle transport v-SNARE N-terminal domain-containing protein n=1 Tax=Smittium simulii TaxID=133385 RepID=A0A2T9YS59_9FUNG|nr:hypothetical protein BB561_002057 [Smittium simulii]